MDKSSSYDIRLSKVTDFFVNRIDDLKTEITELKDENKKNEVTINSLHRELELEWESQSNYKYCNEDIFHYAFVGFCVGVYTGLIIGVMSTLKTKR